MAMMLWVRGVMICAGLATVACSGPVQPGHGTGRASHLPATAVTRAIARLPCKATTALGAKPLPATFKPVAVVRCYGFARGVNGHGLWRFNVKQQASHRLGAFIAALRRPSARRPAGTMCTLVDYASPPFALVDRQGRVRRAALPSSECGQPFPAAITDLQRLPWVTVSVRRTVHIATRAELRSGCNPTYGDVIASGPYFRQLPMSSGGPAFSPRPPRLRICLYQRGSGAFLRGGIISQHAESELLAAIQAGRSSASCRRRHTSYAVLEAVSPTRRGGQIAEAEIAGCNRILRPDNSVGTISPAGLKIISSLLTRT
jgi:hypothetical protein